MYLRSLHLLPTSLLLLNLVHSVICNNQVLILKYNNRNDCPKPVVGIPLKSNLVLKEFTFCGKFKFRFLRERLLMAFDEYTYFGWLEDDEYLIVIHCGNTVYAHLKNQNLLYPLKLVNKGAGIHKRLTDFSNFRTIF